MTQEGCLCLHASATVVIVSIWMPCHLLHHAAEKADACLLFSIEEVLVDTYYYLDKTSKRLQELHEYQKLSDVEHHKILKHVSTRWLSVGNCLSRILENWEALKVFFKEKEALPKSADKPTSKPATKPGTSSAKPTATSTESSKPNRYSKASFLEGFYRSPTNKLYCYFLQNAILPFDKLNTTLQCDKPQIHALRRLLHKLMRDLLIRFVVPTAMHGKTVMEVPFDKELYHKKNDNLIIGETARKFLLNKEENHLRESRISEFIENVKKFYVSACTYIQKKLPLNDELLQHAEVADIDLIVHHTSADLDFFLDRFPVLLPKDTSKDAIHLEFADLQSHDLSTARRERMDETWIEVRKMRDTEGVALYPNLPLVMLGVLTIPHSNAQCERIFSCVRKNKTDQRASLGKDTLESLMVVKSKPGDPHNRVYSATELKRLKSSYYNSLKK